MRWNATENQRQMPWKGEKNPYKIWLSEVILQQTRVEQGWQYYERFIAHFPTIEALAQAEDATVFKLWEGLGYYNRCKNLLFTARQITAQNKGIFPQEYEQILALKGIGPYTAAAISSFAFNQPHAVLDGNVFRVLSRYFGIDIPIDSTEGKNYFTTLADQVLDKKNPGIYNQAIMDFGATVCTPALPACGNCALQQHCVAYSTGKVNLLPIKEKILVKKNRYFTWFILESNGEIYIHQRTGKDIWENLYEFYLVETDKKIIWDEVSILSWAKNQLNQKPSILRISPVLQQQLTHRLIKAVFIHLKLTSRPHSLQSNHWVKISALQDYAFPKLPKEYIAQHFHV